MPSPEILDAHHHLWDLSVRHQPWLDTAPELDQLRHNYLVSDLEPLADAAGVTGTVVIQTVTEPGETPEMLAVAEQPSLVQAVVGWVDLEAPDVADALAQIIDGPGGRHLAGIRHPVLIEPDLEWLTRPDVLRGLTAVGQAGLVYDVVCRPEQLPAAAAAAAAAPDLVFALDHLGNVDVQPVPDPQWAAAFRQFADLPNTVAKLSGLMSDPAPVADLRPYYDILLDSFGPARIMFGSDWPVSTLGRPYDGIVSTARELISALSPDEQAAIWSGTGRRVYGIEA
jgi:L-fuconolactonase